MDCSLDWAPAGVFWATAIEAPAMRAESQAPSIETLFRDYAPQIHRLVWRLLGPGASRADVEDLGQQVFVALHLALPKYRGASKVSTWVYGIASRIVYRELRSRTRHRRMVKTLEAKASVIAQRGAERPPQEVRLELTDIWRSLMQVHPKKRMVYVLFEIEGLSGPEIAAALDIKEATVHTRLFHARRELMRRLERER